MSLKLYEENSIQEIADAIRAHNGSTETYTVDEMSDAIQSLSTGSGMGVPAPLLEYAENYGAMIFEEVQTSGSTIYLKGCSSGAVNGNIQVSWDLGNTWSDYTSLYGSYYSYVGITPVNGMLYNYEYNGRKFLIGLFKSKSTTFDNVNNQASYVFGMLSTAESNKRVFFKFVHMMFKYFSYGTYDGGEENVPMYIQILPKKVTTLSGTSIKTILIIPKHTTPPTLSNSSYLEYNNLGVYVPDSLLNNFKTDTNWCIIADYIYPISECPYID